jgi:modulator of FtsH protease HflK
MDKKTDNQGAEIFAIDGKGPWDVSGSGGDASQGSPGNKGELPADEPKAGPKSPWDPVPGNERQSSRARGPSLEDLLRRAGGGGKGGGFGGIPKRADGKSWWPIIVGGLVIIWLAWTSIHRLGPEQEGVVTTFGKYSRTVGSGISFTLPTPIQRMEKLDTQQIRTTSVGSSKAASDNLVLTKDQNIIDMAYDIRWSIKDPELFLFQLDQPEQSVQEIGESAMRAAVANFNLTQAIGDGRSDIEAQVRQRMQQILDEYRAGVMVQSISIRQSDPPAEVNEAFREVNVAQQQRESYINNARATASQIKEQALGATIEFDKIYEQYKQAPDVTRRRLYYETMESVLSKVDKTVVGSNSGVTPYLPIPEFKKRADSSTSDVTVTESKR